jgi:High-temperature-induced dauer-formation protein
MKATHDSYSSCKSHRHAELYLLNHDSRLEIFNSIIAHHPSENPNVVYALLRAHRTFEDLGTFTLARGLRDVRRIQRAKEEQPHDTKGKSRAAEEEYDQPHQEKQRMLERENALGISSTEQSVDSLTEVRVVPRDSPQQEETEEAPSPVLPSMDRETPPGFPTAVSEKARGKMPERRSMSLDTDNSLDRVTATAVGRNGFVPTQEWVRIKTSSLRCWDRTDSCAHR